LPKQNEVKNKEGLHKALLIHIGKSSQFTHENDLSPTSLYRILNGKRKTVRIQTLKKISDLTALYSSVQSIDAIERLNSYFRQYVRYASTPWRFDVEEVLAERFSDPHYTVIEDFCRKMGLSTLYGYLCTWYYEGSERDKLIQILTQTSL